MHIGRSAPRKTLMALTAVAVVIAVVLSSAGCLVEEEKPSTKVAVPDDRKDARLVVDGLVATPLNWTLQQVVDLGLVDFKATFVNSVGTTLTSNYTGVRVRSILERASACATVELLEVEASDGYKALIFLSDISNDSFIALKEEGRWQNLSDTGAVRFVDTHMGSVYWVKKVVAMHLKRSTSLSLSGLENYLPASYITAAELHSRANLTVTWKEGTKTRSAMGMGIWEVGDWLNITGSFLELLGPGQQRVVHNASFDPSAPVALKDYLTVDSKGRFVFVSGDSPLAVGFTELRSLNGIHIHGDVTKEINITTSDLDELPQRNVTSMGGRVQGPSLEAVLGLAGLGPGATSVLIGPGNGTLIEIPIWDLANYTIFENQKPWIWSMFPIYALILAHQDITGMGWFVVEWADVRTA
jgi:DMSO/TMAO reductase YedYZ molybdopterin-dependent catalytic subunit